MNFKASGVEVVDVHNLTLAELNRATNKASGTTRTDSDISSGFKDLTGAASGLFNMQKFQTGLLQYFYWLASPYEGSGNYVCSVIYDEDVVFGLNRNDLGIRPVVTLPSSVNLTVVE